MHLHVTDAFPPLIVEDDCQVHWGKVNRGTSPIRKRPTPGTDSNNMPRAIVVLGGARF